MAKKKRRREGEGGTGVSPPAARPTVAPASAETAPPVEVDVPLPGWRWHLGVFLGCLAAAALILWGGYVPLMRYQSRKYIATGDAYLAWAKRFDEDPARAEALAGRFDSINRILAPMGRTLREWQETWTRYGLPMTEPENDVSRRFKGEFATFPDRLQALKDEIDAAAAESGLFEEIPHLRTTLNQRFERARDGIRDVSGQVLVMDRAQHFFPQITNFRLYLEAVIQFRNCFDRETTLDEAMSAYLDAVAFGRRWVPPRMKLADLYAFRGWTDMAAEEYVKVVRLDPRGAGEEALGKIRALAEGEKEVSFHLGVAHLARGEYEEAAAAFETVVRWAPAGLYGPRAESLVALARSGDRRAIEDFVQDQVFL